MNKHLLLWMLCSLQLLRCSLVPLAGGSTDTELGCVVSGRVHDGQGKPALHTQIDLIPRDYNPVIDAPLTDRLIDTTDSNGIYFFAGVKSGAYNIEAVQLGERTRALIYGITVANDTVTAPDDSLQRPGYIRVMLPDDVDAVNGYVFIPGTTFASYLDENAQSVTLDSVPAGMVATVCLAGKNGTALPRLIADSVRVNPGDTTIVSAGAWRSVRNLRINTAPSGAGVAGDVYNFPVLIRLTKDNFDFSTARALGEDLRFAKTDNSPLPYEIERFDPVGKLAEIWVRVDTVHGNDSTQSFLMYWGNDTAAGNSNGAAVFDTANGFAGVWHLGQPVGSIIPDATANGNNGTAISTATVSGAAGMAQSFDGTSSLIRTSGSNMDKLNFPENGTFSVSAWVNANAVDSLFHGIIYKSNLQYGLQIRPENVWDFNTFIDKTGWEGSRSTASAGSWHFLTGVRNGTRQYLYVDGTCVDSTEVLEPSLLTRVYDTSLQIGHCPDGGLDPDRYFSGNIDEVRVSGVADSPDWIKLCYMNQKQQDALVIFR